MRRRVGSEKGGEGLVEGERGWDVASDRKAGRYGDQLGDQMGKV